MNQRHGSALDTMLDALREAADGEERADFNRANVIGILKVLAEHLDPLLEEPSVQNENGEAVIRHTAVEQLLALASALDDLDTGLTDPVLRRIAGKKNSARRWRLRQEDEVLFEALEILQRIKRLPDKKAAARRLAVTLQSSDYRRSGKTLKGASLYALYNKYR